jgi:uncharacterized protein (TIGR02594 family)
MSEPIHRKVLDISHHNGVSSWNEVKNAGIIGIIHKATEGTDFVDGEYRRRRNEATAAGLKWGAYHFAHSGSVSAQVDHFLNITGIDDQMLYSLDWEDPPNGATMTLEEARRFCELVEERTGRKCVIYSGNVAKELLGSRSDPYFGAHRLWLAQYGTDPSWQASWDDYWLWQYSDGNIGPQPHGCPGMTGDVDTNSWAHSDQQLRDEWSGVARPERPPARPPEVGEVPHIVIRVSATAPVTIDYHEDVPEAPGSPPGGPGRPDRPPGQTPPPNFPPLPASPGMLQAAAPIAIGDEGDEVTQLQQALVAAGASLEIDGDYGPITETAVEAHQARRHLPVTGWVDEYTGASLDRFEGLQAAKRHRSTPGAPWVAEVRACTGVDEISGSADSPIIMAWRLDITHEFPEMASYTSGYTGDDIAWCGYGLAAAMARAGIRPPYNPSDDTESYMWALAWAEWGQRVEPRVGAIWTSEREGGGHVAIIEGISGNTVYIRGFNQSDTVNVTTKSLGDLVSARWPSGWPVVDVEGDTSFTGSRHEFWPAPPGSEA